MVILHCMSRKMWIDIKNEKKYGRKHIDTNGYIHCSSVEHFWRVAPHFINDQEALIILCIDTDKVEAEIKWEDTDNCGREYPHIYGELNIDSIVNVVPFKKDEDNKFLLNEELKQYLEEKSKA